MIADTGGAGLTNCVLYTRTGPRRSSWFGKTTVLFRTISNDREPVFTRVGAAPDGRGFAVWQDKVGEMWATPLRQASGKYRPRAIPGRPARLRRSRVQLGAGEAAAVDGRERLVDRVGVVAPAFSFSSIASRSGVIAVASSSSASHAAASAAAVSSTVSCLPEA